MQVATLTSLSAVEIKNAQTVTLLNSEEDEAVTALAMKENLKFLLDDIVYDFDELEWSELQD